MHCIKLCRESMSYNLSSKVDRKPASSFLALNSSVSLQMTYRFCNPAVNLILHFKCLHILHWTCFRIPNVAQHLLQMDIGKRPSRPKAEFSVFMGTASNETNKSLKPQGRKLNRMASYCHLSE